MPKEKSITRRSFIHSVFSRAALAMFSRFSGFINTHVQKESPLSTMPTRLLGKTGFHVSLLSLGGQATLEDETKHDLALEIIHKALDLGVNYFDTAAAYGHGISELYIGEVMKTRRSEVFLASKTYDRSYDGSMRSLEKSLKRLQTDHLDLWQLHNIQTNTDVDFILSREGAVKALEHAREQGVVRFTGITGHKDPFVLRRALEQYSFDAILMALNAADKHQASFIDHLLPFAVEKNMGIIGMKVPSRGRIFHEHGIKTMEQAMRYVLTLPVSTIAVGISTIRELEENVQIACSFQPYTPAEMSELEKLTQPYSADALWYRDHM
jgi:uncharacterized protein